ncbi:MAG TPA: LuxR C-terminal-related transcriptional regulator [Aldersonia sp.]
MAVVWPLRERDFEFETVRSTLSRTGRPCGVMLSGDAGVGKTSLARRVTETLDVQVRWVAGTASARTIPLGAFAHVLGDRTLGDPASSLGATRDSLLAHGPVVLGVDDAHLLDQLSATLLHQIAIDGVARIVATVRSGEAVPDAVTSLWKDGYLTRLDLDPFNREQSIELVETALGGHLEGLSAELMWQASGGNALFLRHLVEGALEVGRLRAVRGVWQLRGSATVTRELTTLVEARIERLPDGIIDVLNVVSQCEPLDIDVLVELCGDQAVEVAEQRGVVQVVDDDRQRLTARFTHPLFGEVIRRRLGELATRRVRGRLVTALGARGGLGDSDRMTIAELALGSDKSVEAELLISAARSAVALSDVALGERFARAALQRGGGITAADLLARALLWQGRAQEVEEVLDGFDPDTLDEVSLLRWGMTRVSNQYFSIGDADEGDRILALLKSRIADPSAALIVVALESGLAYHQNRLSDAVAIGERVLAAPNASPWATAWAAIGVGRSLGPMGRGGEIDEVARKLRRVRDRIDGLLAYPAGFGEIQALTFCARFAEADDVAAQFRGFTTSGQYLAWGMTCTMIGWVDVARGKLGKAVEVLEDSIAALSTERSAGMWIYPARIALAKAYAGLGRASDARAVITDADEQRGRHNLVFDPQVRVAEAWCAAAEGTPMRAIEIAHVAADTAARSDQFAVEAEALHVGARFGDHRAAPRLTDLAARLDGALVPLHARHAEAVAAADALALDDCAAAYERLGAYLDAADAAAQAATAHGQRGDRRANAASAATANRLSVLCGGLATPAVRTAAQPLPLTVREREIATLIAAGLSNREISERLVLSVRTVEGHIYRACEKLDLADRDQLARLVLDPSA